MDPMRSGRNAQASGSGNVAAAGDTARKPRKKPKAKATTKVGSIPAPFLAIAPSPASAVISNRQEAVSGVGSSSRSPMVLPSHSRPSPYNRAGGASGSGRPSESPIKRRKYAAGLLAPPSIMPGGQAAEPRIQGRTSPVPGGNRRRSTERLYAAQQPISVVQIADPGGTSGDSRLGTRHRSSERLRELGQANASMMSLGHLGRILETDPNDAVTAPNPSTSRDQTQAQTGRRRRRIVRGDGGLTRRLTVSTREEGRALSLARGASMRRTNVWDGLPETEDPPPAFPFPTAATSRLPPAFETSSPPRPTAPARQPSDTRSRSPPPTFEQAIGLLPLPAPLTPSVDPEPPPLGTILGRPTLSLNPTAQPVGPSSSPPTSPTGTQYASAPSSPIRSEAGLTGIGEEDEEEGGLNAAMREDRRMWNADLLAGYTLEERVRREIERRMFVAGDAEASTVQPVIALVQEEIEAATTPQDGPQETAEAPLTEAEEAQSIEPRNTLMDVPAISISTPSKFASTPESRQSPIPSDSPSTEKKTRTPRRRPKKPSTDGGSSSTAKTRKSTPARTPAPSVGITPSEQIGEPINLEENLLGSRFVESIADESPKEAKPERSFKITSRPFTRVVDDSMMAEQTATSSRAKASDTSIASSSGQATKGSSDRESGRAPGPTAQEPQSSQQSTRQVTVESTAVPVSRGDESPAVAVVDQTRPSAVSSKNGEDTATGSPSVINLGSSVAAVTPSEARSQTGSDRVIAPTPPSRKLTRGKAIRRISADKASPIRSSSIKSKPTLEPHQKPLFSSPGYTAAELEGLPLPSRMQTTHRLSEPTLKGLPTTETSLPLRDRTMSQPNVHAHQDGATPSGLPPHREAALKRRELALGRIERKVPIVSAVPTSPPLVEETKEVKQGLLPPTAPTADHLLIDLNEAWPSTHATSLPQDAQNLRQLAVSTAELLQLLEDDSVAESSAQGAARAAAIQTVKESVSEMNEPVAPRKKPPPPPASRARRSEVAVSHSNPNSQPASIETTPAASEVASNAPPSLPSRRPPPPPPSASLRAPPLPPRPGAAVPRPPQFDRMQSYVSTADSSISERDNEEETSHVPQYQPRARTSLSMRPRGPRPIPPPVPPRPWVKVLTTDIPEPSPSRPVPERSVSDTSVAVSTTPTSPQRSMSVADLRTPVREVRETRSPEYTDLDVYVSRLEGSGREYEGFAHLTAFLGPAKNPAASQAALETLFTALVQVDSRRTNAQGKVKLKLSLLGVRVTKCPICLSQFKGGDKAVMLPMCGHVGHETCVRRWFREDGKCFVCREVLREM